MAPATISASAKANAKPSKEPKSKKSAAAPKKARAYPPYSVMIEEAIVALKERTGSSQIAIGKFIEEKQKPNLPSNFKKLLLLQLKKLVANGKLVKVKNSFKLPSKTSTAALPKPKITVASRTAAAEKYKKKAVKPATRKAPGKSAAVKSPGKKVAAVNKKAPGKVVKVIKSPVKGVKKPTSIKSPVKKVTVKKAKK